MIDSSGGRKAEPLSDQRPRSNWSVLILVITGAIAIIAGISEHSSKDRLEAASMQPDR